MNDFLSVPPVYSPPVNSPLLLVPVQEPPVMILYEPFTNSGDENRSEVYALRHWNVNKDFPLASSIWNNELAARLWLHLASIEF